MVGRAFEIKPFYFVYLIEGLLPGYRYRLSVRLQMSTPSKDMPVNNCLITQDFIWLLREREVSVHWYVYISIIYLAVVHNVSLCPALVFEKAKNVHVSVVTLSLEIPHNRCVYHDKILTSDTFHMTITTFFAHGLAFSSGRCD